MPPPLQHPIADIDLELGTGRGVSFAYGDMIGYPYYWPEHNLQFLVLAPHRYESPDAWIKRVWKVTITNDNPEDLEKVYQHMAQNKQAQVRAGDGYTIVIEPGEVEVAGEDG